MRVRLGSVRKMYLLNVNRHPLTDDFYKFYNTSSCNCNVEVLSFTPNLEIMASQQPLHPQLETHK